MSVDPDHVRIAGDCPDRGERFRQLLEQGLTFWLGHVDPAEIAEGQPHLETPKAGVGQFLEKRRGVSR